MLIKFNKQSVLYGHLIIVVVGNINPRIQSVLLHFNEKNMKLFSANIFKLLLTLVCCSLMPSGFAFAATAQGYVHEVSGDVQAQQGAGKPVKLEKTKASKTTPPLRPAPTAPQC